MVLINEKTASFAEQNLLYLESVCANVCGGVTFVGTPTNGSVGKLTNVKLPGEVSTCNYSCYLLLSFIFEERMLFDSNVDICWTQWSCNEGNQW